MFPELDSFTLIDQKKLKELGVLIEQSELDLFERTGYF